MCISSVTGEEKVVLYIKFTLCNTNAVVVNNILFLSAFFIFYMTTLSLFESYQAMLIATNEHTAIIHNSKYSCESKISYKTFSLVACANHKEINCNQH